MAIDDYMGDEAGAGPDLDIGSDMAPRANEGAGADARPWLNNGGGMDHRLGKGIRDGGAEAKNLRHEDDLKSRLLAMKLKLCVRGLRTLDQVRSMIIAA
jgi:hypothetical protein